MNIETEKGFRQATAWTRRQLDLLCDGGVWAIPRSFSAVRVVSHKRLEAEITGMSREPHVVAVMRALGWQCKDMDAQK